jgi:hypothetical protein
MDSRESQSILATPKFKTLRELFSVNPNYAMYLFGAKDVDLDDCERS